MTMTPDQVKFTINEPCILKLADTTPDSDGPNWIYSTSDGRTLSLPRHAAVRLGALFLEAGEEFSIGRYRKSAEEPAEWVVALTARTEQSRAAKEAFEAERKARELAEETRLNLPQKLDASLQNLRKMPIPERSSPVAEAERGTGTHGPAPRPARAQRPVTGAVPFNVAFVEVTRFVVDGLKAVGEQWNDQAKQDAICSVLISASRQGLLTLWERQQ
jgi:hypothetical protein